ncbi:MAG: serine/threonine protein kinase [Planctomycetota bacterium]|nr:MAG: serine/threonine protein kinase [Planctomycetota bacterium]
MGIIPKPGLQIDQYLLEEQIGEGGAGSVFKAQIIGMNRQVVLKILLPSLAQDRVAVARFKREALAVSQLNHPNIISIYNIGKFQGLFYLVMPLLEGGNLYDEILNGPIPIPRVLEISYQLCHAIGAAHELDIIHRDIKPENILFHQGRVILTDFGLATQEGMQSITMAGARIGTPLYMSPEQAKGQKVDSRTDIYSLGIVIYEMVTGHPPFPVHLPVFEILKRISQGKKIPFHQQDIEVPRDLQHIINRATRISPNERYQSAKDLEMDLKAFEMGQPLSRDPFSSVKIQRKSIKSSHLPHSQKKEISFALVVSAVICLSILFGFLGVLLFEPSSHKEKRSFLASLKPGLHPSSTSNTFNNDGTPGGKLGTGTNPDTGTGISVGTGTDMGTGTGNVNSSGTGSGNDSSSESPGSKPVSVGTGTGSGTGLGSAATTGDGTGKKPPSSNHHTTTPYSYLFPPPAPPPSSQTVWQDLWGGTWRGVPGKPMMMGKGAGTGPFQFSALRLTLALTKNYQGAIQFKLIKGDSNGKYAGIFMGAQDPKNMFLFYICDSDRERKALPPSLQKKWKKNKVKPVFFRIARLVKGNWAHIKTVLIPGSQNNWYEFQFILRNGVVQFFINRKPLPFMIKYIPHGSFGFIKFYQTEVVFRQLILKSIP